MSEIESGLGAGKRRRLGRGLSGMIGSAVVIDHSPEGLATEAPVRVDAPNGGAATGGVPSAPKSEYILIDLPIGSIIPNRHQPRRDFDEAALRSLAASIKKDGLMQPVMVRPGSGGGGTGGRYELIAGERRWRAARIAGLERLPAIVRSAGDRDSAELALIENVHRQDLNAIERAEAMAQLIERHGLTQQEVADTLGMDRSSVANLVRLTELEDEIRALIATDRLGAGHGKVLLATAPGRRIELAERAAAGMWSVRELERQSRLAAQRAVPRGEDAVAQEARRDAVRADLEKRLSEKLGTKVKINATQDGMRGKLIIDFYDLNHFGGLLKVLGVGE